MYGTVPSLVIRYVTVEAVSTCCEKGSSSTFQPAATAAAAVVMRPSRRHVDILKALQALTPPCVVSGLHVPRCTSTMSISVYL